MDYQKQKRQFSEKAVDVLVATPGRLLDFFKQKVLILDKVEILVIDEADRMLDMGFIPDVRKIVLSTPPKEKRQTLFFSATLTDDVQRLSYSWTRDPVKVEIEPEQVAAETVEQVIYTVTAKEKSALLYNIIQRQNLYRVIVFCNRRDETRKVADLFYRYNINCAVLSGDVPQKKRLRTLEDFKEGKIRVLVATDVAGRGLHIEGMSHVINYTLPFDPEDYVHRIGRTGRAGATGTSISFACEDDAFQIPKIQEFLGQELRCIQPEEEWLQLPPPVRKQTRPPRRNPDKRPRRNRQQRKD
jgi:ATP-dependent RNA helicase RhlB